MGEEVLAWLRIKYRNLSYEQLQKQGLAQSVLYETRVEGAAEYDDDDDGDDL